MARRAASSSLSSNRLLGTRTRVERAPSFAVASASTPYSGSTVETFIATALTRIAALALFRPSCRRRSRDSLAAFFGLTAPRAAPESSTTSPSLARRPVVVVAPFPSPRSLARRLCRRRSFSSASSSSSSPSSSSSSSSVASSSLCPRSLSRSRASPSSTTTSARTSSMRSFLATSVPRRRAPSLVASSSNDAHM